MVVSTVQNIWGDSKVSEERMAVAEVGLLRVINTYDPYERRNEDFVSYARNQIANGVVDAYESVGETGSAEALAKKAATETERMKRDFVYRDMLQGTLRESVATLPKDQAAVVRGYVGTGRREGLSIASIGKDMGLQGRDVLTLLQHGVQGVVTNERFSALAELYSLDEVVRKAYAPLKLTQPGVRLLEKQSGAKDITIPDGVNSETYNFFLTAKALGLLQALDEGSEAVLNMYYKTNTSILDLYPGQDQTTRSIGERIRRQLLSVWKEMPAPLLVNYNKTEVISMKKEKLKRYTLTSLIKELKDEPQMQEYVRRLRQEKGRLEIPVKVTGVPPKTYAFLLAARETGALDKINPMQRAILNDYFTKDTSLSELVGKQTYGKWINAVRRRLLVSLTNVWEQLPVSLQQVFPKEEVVALKAKKGRRLKQEIIMRMADGHRGTTRTAETKTKMSKVRTEQEKEKRRTYTVVPPEDTTTPASGVKAETHKFIAAAKETDAVSGIDPNLLAGVYKYYYTETTVADVADEAGYKNRRYFSGMLLATLDTIWEQSSPTVQQQFLKEEVMQLKAKKGRKSRMNKGQTADVIYTTSS